MKKIYGVIIALYLIGATLLIIFAPKPKSIVHMAVIEQYYSQLLTEDEERFEVLIYLSEKDTFLTLKKAITDARLVSETNEMEVQIDTIEELDIMTRYKNQDYYVFRFSFDLTAYRIDHLVMDFNNAILQISYDNDEIIQFDIGNVYFLYESLPEVTDFDFFRLSGLFGNVMDQTVFQGLLIGFDRFIEDDIIIKKISCGIDVIDIKLEDAILYQTISEGSTLYETLGIDYNPIVTTSLSNQFEFKITPSALYAIPIQYHDKFIDLWRFPLIIEYEKNSEQKTLLIDDFMFKTETMTLSEETLDVHQYQYRYRD